VLHYRHTGDFDLAGSSLDSLVFAKSFIRELWLAIERDILASLLACLSRDTSYATTAEILQAVT